MKDEPTLAVIVPVLNEQVELPVLIRRLKELSAAEVVIVDGGSIDGTCDILDDSGIRWLAASQGRAGQMNAGAAICTSDIFLFIHSDTEINSYCIEAMIAAMQLPETVGGRFDLCLSGGHPALRMVEWFINLRSRLSGISTGDQGIFVRRCVFDQLGGFPDLPLMEDVAFSRRLKRRGHIACLRERVTTSSRRWEQHGLLKTILLMWRLRLLFWLGVPAQRLAAMYREAR